MDDKIISGKAISEKIRTHLKEKVKNFVSEKGRKPGLAVILAGDDPASQIYVGNKQKGCEETGIYSEVINFSDNITQEDLIQTIRELNARTDIDGILVQLPLPEQIDELTVIKEIAPNKDVDGFHILNAGALFTGQPRLTPCTPLGIIELIKSVQPDISGKNAVVIGRSNIVGKPVAMLLLMENATVTLCHSKTKGLNEICKNADILVSAIGRPEFVTKDFIKPGAIVIDVGTTRVDGKLKGDVLFDEAYDIAGHITPVPGGVGPMTITMLLENTLKAALLNE